MSSGSGAGSNAADRAPRSGYDVVVLAGGSARRLGGVDKPALPVGGRRLLDRVLAGCAGAERIVVVGPQRPIGADVAAGIGARVRWCREEPPGGGPLAAVAAAVAHTSADVVVVVAADMPFVAPAIPALAALVAAVDVVAPPAEPADPADPVARPVPDAAALVDDEGVRQPLAAAYRRDALLRRLDAHPVPAGRPVRTLLVDLAVAVLPAHAIMGDAPGQAAMDCDRWEDVRRAEAVVRETDRDDQR